MSYQGWAQERLAVVPGAVTHPDLARADYIGWASDRHLAGMKIEARSKQRGAVRAVGGRPKGIGKDLRYHDVEVLPLTEGLLASPDEVIAALRALQRSGLVTDRSSLNSAFSELTARHHG